MKTYLKIIFTAVITAIITFSITSVFFTVRQMDVTANSSSKSLGRKIETVNTYLENNYLYDNVDYKKAWAQIDVSSAHYHRITGDIVSSKI